MIATKQTLYPNNRTTEKFVFVLWGEQFEEAAAAIFTTKIRQSGLCVKVIGLAGTHSVGKNGLALYPDITLGEALTRAEQAICIVLPCSIGMLKQIEADPRLVDLFKTAHRNGAKFVIRSLDSFEQSRLGKICLTERSRAPHSVLPYGNENNLLIFASELGAQLSMLGHSKK